MSPPKAFGGIEVPPRDWSVPIDAIWDELRAQRIAIETLSASNETLIQRVNELEDGQRPSVVSVDFEQRVIAALERHKSSPPDVEIKSGDRSVRGQWWVVITLALCVVLFAALWQGPELIEAMRGK